MRSRTRGPGGHVRSSLDMKIEAGITRYRDIPEDQIVRIDHATLQGMDYSNRKLVKFSAIGCRLENCKFDHVEINDASFGAGGEQSEYVDCSFDNARMTIPVGGYARFAGCSFRDVDIGSWICFAVEVIDCAFSGKLRGAIFNGTVPLENRKFANSEKNEFRGNDFSAVKFMDVTFRTGIDLTQQRLPSGPGYIYVPDPVAVLARSRQYVAGNPGLELEVRHAAARTLERMQQTVDKGQKQLFISLDTYYAHGSLPGEGLELALSLLRNDGWPDRRE